MADQNKSWQEKAINLAPSYLLKVQGNSLEDVAQFVSSVSFDNSDAVVDAIEIEAQNPDFFLSERKVFTPGNEIELWGGYEKLVFLSRGIIERVKLNFPRGDGMPTLRVTAYPKGFKMTQNKPDVETKATRKKYKNWWGKVKVSDVIKEIAARPGYGFKTSDALGPTVEESPQSDVDIYQVPDLTDWELCHGLANMLGWYFWVDGDKDGNWIVHFESPGVVEGHQYTKYTFKYNEGDLSTLLSFEPELLMGEQFTKVVAEMTLASGKVVTKTFAVDQGSKVWNPIVANDWGEEVSGPYASPSQIKLYVKDYAVALPDVTGIQTAAQLEWYIEAWIARHQHEFVLARGATIGVEDLRCRQRHAIAGVGAAFSSDYYFSRVRHSFDADKGYEVDFDARMVE